MLVIYLSAEREKVLSFRDMEFGGAALGISNNGPLSDAEPGSFCSPLRTKYARGEAPLADFYRCFASADFPENNDFANDTFHLMLTGNPRDSSVIILTPSRRWLSFLSLDMSTGETPYRLRNTLSYNEGSKLFERGIAQMMAVCPDGTRSNVTASEIVTHTIPDQWVISAKVQCENYSPQQIGGIGKSMLKNVTMVHAEKFEVSKFANEPFTLGDDLDFLIRRDSSAIFLSMVIAAAVAITVRLIINSVLTNDAHIAVEAILKDRLGMKCCDSLLQAENLLFYKNRIEVEDAEFDGTNETNSFWVRTTSKAQFFFGR